MSFWKGQAVAFAAMVVATALRIAVDPLVEGMPFITFFPAVAVAAAFGGVWAGLTTVLCSALVAWFGWLDPDPGLLFWKSSNIAVAIFLLLSTLIVLSIQVLRQFMEDLRLAEQRADAMAREMRHRVSNVLALVSGLSRLSAQGAENVEDYREKLDGRMRALVRSQDLLSANGEETIHASDLLKGLLEGFASDRFDLGECNVVFTNDQGRALALMIHELATNAIKYGALSNDTGRVRIECSTAAGRFRLLWKETGGPAVTPPTHEGSGTQLLRRGFSGHTGEVSLSFRPDGVEATLCFPAPRLAAENPPAAVRSMPSRPAGM